MKVAQTTLAALRQQRFLTVRREVGDELAGLRNGDQGADRHAQDDIFGTAPVLIGAAAFFARLGAVDASKAIVDQGINVSLGNRPDAAAAPAVAAVGPAARNVFFTPQRYRPVDAVAGDHFDVSF